MFCGYCGAKLSENARFCGKCGNTVKRAGEQQGVIPPKTPDPNPPVQGGFDNPGVGHGRIGADSYGRVDMGYGGRAYIETPKKKGNAGLWIAIAVAAALVLGAASFALFYFDPFGWQESSSVSDRDEEEEEPEEPKEEEPLGEPAVEEPVDEPTLVKPAEPDVPAVEEPVPEEPVEEPVEEPTEEPVEVPDPEDIPDWAYQCTGMWSGGDHLLELYPNGAELKCYLMYVTEDGDWDEGVATLVNEGEAISCRMTLDYTGNELYVRIINGDHADPPGKLFVTCEVERYGTESWVETSFFDLGFFPYVEPEESLYILPSSDSRYLTEADLDMLTWEGCCLARNEIFARHGRLFATPEIAAYFESMPWYNGTISGGTFDANLSKYLNEYEQYNVNFILDYERAVYGGSYY